MRGVINQFFLPFLSYRTQCVSFNNCSSSLADIEIDVPQGSSLGPLLFLLYINNLTNYILCTLQLFADDTYLLISESTPEKLQIEFKKDITSVCNWLNTYKFTLNKAKWGELSQQVFSYFNAITQTFFCKGPLFFTFLHKNRS